jgi:hypothetical protein
MNNQHSKVAIPLMRKNGMTLLISQTSRSLRNPRVEAFLALCIDSKITSEINAIEIYFFFATQ